MPIFIETMHDRRTTESCWSGIKQPRYNKQTRSEVEPQKHVPNVSGRTDNHEVITIQEDLVSDMHTFPNNEGY
jgi:hypothetical protein